jgi:2-polyprenyl-6-methoxyphenol hydroxylase-like FAD-dependent oxidoreductase
MNMMRVRIIGGSLAGLFAAALLSRDGHDVVVYERSVHGLEGRGAGLLGKRETFAIVRAAGCEHVARIGVVARERIVFGDAGPVVDRAMAPQMQISWDTLYRTFRHLVPDGGYVLGRKAAHVRQDADQAWITFEDGDEEEADLVVGADGIASVARCAVNGGATVNAYAGYVGWRGLLPEGSLPADAAAELLERFAFYRMHRSHVVGFLVAGPNGEIDRGARRYNWVWYRQASGESGRASVFTDRRGRVHPYSLPPGAVPDQAVDALKRDARRLLPPSFAAAVEATAQPFVQGVFDYETRSMALGRIALIGDAAFVVRPHTGMGIAKAAGDVMSLRKHLAALPLPDALHTFEQERMPVGATLAAYGRTLGERL